MLPGFPESGRILDSTSALEVADVPRRLLVVGGGYIGLELGTVYAALGSKAAGLRHQPLASLPLTALVQDRGRHRERTHGFWRQMGVAHYFSRQLLVGLRVAQVHDALADIVQAQLTVAMLREIRL